MNLQCSGRACCLFAVWLSVAVLSLYNFFILFFVYINRIVSNNFYCNSLPKGQRRWLVVGKLEHTRKEPFSCAAENSSFSKLFRFIFNVLLFCSVFVILIILTCYFCVLSVSVCVGVLFVCVCFLEKQTTISKNSSSWVRKTFFSSTLVQYIIIFVLLCSIFIRIQKFTNTTLILCCLLFIIVCISLFVCRLVDVCASIALRRKIIAIIFIHLLHFLYGNYYSSLCDLCESMLLSFQLSASYNEN